MNSQSKDSFINQLDQVEKYIREELIPSSIKDDLDIISAVYYNGLLLVSSQDGHRLVEYEINDGQKSKIYTYKLFYSQISHLEIKSYSEYLIGTVAGDIFLYKKEEKESNKLWNNEPFVSMRLKDDRLYFLPPTISKALICRLV